VVVVVVVTTTAAYVSAGASAIPNQHSFGQPSVVVLFQIIVISV
jgi:hypothetical protein